LMSQQLNKPDELEAALSSAGFTEVQVKAEHFDFVFADKEAWWARQWAQGGQYDLEGLEPEKLEQFKAAAFERVQACMQPDGPHRNVQVLFGLGVEPEV